MMFTDGCFTVVALLDTSIASYIRDDGWLALPRNNTNWN